MGSRRSEKIQDVRQKKQYYIQNVGILNFEWKIVRDY